MKATKDRIGSETAKLLKDCEVESKSVCIQEVSPNMKGEPIVSWRIKKRKGILALYLLRDNYPAYTWQEIEDDAEVFFGKDRGSLKCETCGRSLGSLSQKCTNKKCLHTVRQKGVWKSFFTSPIKKYLKQKKYEEADLYFRKNCKLIK